jgi:hypothetical protein
MPLDGDAGQDGSSVQAAGGAVTVQWPPEQAPLVRQVVEG